MPVSEVKREALVFPALLHMHEQLLEEWRKLRLWDTVSLSVRMLYWELRIIKLDLLPDGVGLRPNLPHLS